MKPKEGAAAPMLASLFGTPAMEAVFCDRARIKAMLDFEAGLACAEATCGVIPHEAALVIAAHCQVANFDLDALAAASALAGNLAIPLVRELTAQVRAADPNAAGFVHWGATSQDVIDSGLVLQLDRALGILLSELNELIDAQLVLIERERATILSGRTWLQQAVPVTFGLKVAGWLDACLRHRTRLAQARGGLVLQFGGAAGTLASLGDKGTAVSARLSAELGLPLPDLPWHSQRDRLAEIAAVLGMLVGTLGKVARDVSLLMQTEVGEAAEPREPGRGGSSSMPNKQNPVAAANILSAALRVPPLVSTMLSAMVQEHERGLGGWHAEWEVLPEIFRLSAGALHQSTAVTRGLEIDASRMRANLDSSKGLQLAEAVSMALGPSLGRAPAHALIARASRDALAAGSSLRSVLETLPLVTDNLSAGDLDRLLDPAGYLGSTPVYIDAVLARARRVGTATGTMTDTKDPA